jgi:hypothetical protein
MIDVVPTARSMADDSDPETTADPATRTLAAPTEAVGVTRNERVRYPTLTVYDLVVDENEGDNEPLETPSADSRVSGTVADDETALADPRKFDRVSTMRTKPGVSGV